MAVPDRFRPWYQPTAQGGGMIPPAAPPVYAPPPAPPNFIDTLRKLWRHRGLVLMITFVFGVLTVVIVKMMPSYYVAESRILVGVPPTRALNIEAIIADVSPDADRVQNESFIIMSRDLARDTIERLDLTKNPEFNPLLREKSLVATIVSHLNPLNYIPESWLAYFGDKEAATQPMDEREREINLVTEVLLSKLDVSTLGRSHVLSVQAQSVDPQMAATIANTIAASYLAHQRLDKIEATEEVEKFLAERIAELREQVEKSDLAVEQYRRENKIYQAANTGVTTQQLTELNTQLIVAQTAKAEADARLSEAQALRNTGITGDSVPEVLRSPLIQALKQQEAEAAGRLADLSGQFGARHPRVISAKAEIADVRGKIRNEINSIIGGLRHEARTATARYETLRKNFERLQSQLGGVNEKSVRLASLEREATVNRNLLEQMLSRAKETMGLEQLQKPNAKLISKAAPPSGPSFPPKTLILFLGLLGGGLIGTVIALLRDSADQTFRRGEQVETMTGLPVLALVPAMRGRMEPIVHVLRRPISPYTEALRKLHIGLELSEAAQSPKTVLFGSAVPGEGKSVLVASLGRMLASQGRRVLLIDCDWRNPRLHQLFRCANSRGLAALLRDEEDNLDRVIFTDSLSGVDVIPAGMFTPEAMRYLTSERMRLILNALAPRYDLVLIDTAPVLVGAEVLTLARMVDKVAFTVRWGDTRRETVMEALKELLEVDADIAGIVLARVDPRQYRKYAVSHLSYEYERPMLVKTADWA